MQNSVEPLKEAPTKKVELPRHLLHFKVGELLPWKGTWFEVTELTVEGLTLKARKPIEKKHETI
jgi:hypothetical protein